MNTKKHRLNKPNKSNKTKKCKPTNQEVDIYCNKTKVPKWTHFGQVLVTFFKNWLYKK